MARGSSSAKVNEWRARLERFEKSGLTGKRFCTEERVSVASFYAWRRKLRAHPTKAASPRKLPKKHTSRAFTPIVLSPVGAPVSIRLPDGVEIEVPSDNRTAVRTVIRELVRADRVPGKGTCWNGARLKSPPRTRSASRSTPRN